MSPWSPPGSTPHAQRFGRSASITGVASGQFRNALHTVDRLCAARDRHRELVLVIYAALRDPTAAERGSFRVLRVRRCPTERGVSLPVAPAADGRKK